MNQTIKAKITNQALNRHGKHPLLVGVFIEGAEWMYEELMKSAVTMRARQKAVRELCSDEENKGILDRIQERNDSEKSFDELMGLE